MKIIFFVFAFFATFKVHADCFLKPKATSCKNIKSCLVFYPAAGCACSIPGTGASAASAACCSQASLETLKIVAGVSSAASCVCGIGTKATATGIHHRLTKQLRNLVLTQDDEDPLFQNFYHQLQERAQVSDIAFQSSTHTIFQLIQDANRLNILCSPENEEEKKKCCSAFASCLWSVMKLICIGDRRQFWSVNQLMDRILDGSLSQRIALLSAP